MIHNSYKSGIVNLFCLTPEVSHCRLRRERIPCLRSDRPQRGRPVRKNPHRLHQQNGGNSLRCFSSKIKKPLGALFFVVLVVFQDAKLWLGLFNNCPNHA